MTSNSINDFINIPGVVGYMHKMTPRDRAETLQHFHQMLSSPADYFVAHPDHGTLMGISPSAIDYLHRYTKGLNLIELISMKNQNTLPGFGKLPDKHGEGPIYWKTVLPGVLGRQIYGTDVSIKECKEALAIIRCNVRIDHFHLVAGLQKQIRALTQEMLKEMLEGFEDDKIEAGSRFCSTVGKYYQSYPEDFTAQLY